MFGLELEARLLGTDVVDIKQQLNNINDPFEVLELVHKLLNAKGEAILNEDQKQLFYKQLQETSLKDIDMMCSKRLRDIYYNNEPIEDIVKFIPMLESVMT